MSYSNVFLRDFRPVFLGILNEKKLQPAQVALEIIDEEPDGEGIFEPVGVREVLEQLAEDLNFLTIYTERPAYFFRFAEIMYEENGLIVNIFSKTGLKQSSKSMVYGVCKKSDDRCGIVRTLILDFEWEGDCHMQQMQYGKFYVPIHKKPWEKGENLDIRVPIGYNIVIVKGIQNKRKKPRRDRFEEAFYMRE